MADNEIRFDDGGAYERFMGHWSQRAGHAFIEWLGIGAGKRWLDVGCGNGAFTQLIVERCAPQSVHGIDPSGPQIAFARARAATRAVTFSLGDAMALPFPDGAFDAVVMPLVLFFVPEPARGVAEMRRVADRGATIAAYSWDMPGGGFPYAAVQAEMRAIGLPVAMPPSADASRMEAMQALWTAAGLQAIATRELVVERSFADFDAYWAATLDGPGFGARLAELTADDRARLRDAVQRRLGHGGTGPLVCSARANAIQGRVPD